MNNGSNRSIDPSCTDKPPLAIDIILGEYAGFDTTDQPVKCVQHDGGSL